MCDDACTNNELLFTNNELTKSLYILMSLIHQHWINEMITLNCLGKQHVWPTETTSVMLHWQWVMNDQFQDTHTTPPHPPTKNIYIYTTPKLWSPQIKMPLNLNSSNSLSKTMYQSWLTVTEHNDLQKSPFLGQRIQTALLIVIWIFRQPAGNLRLTFVPICYPCWWSRYSVTMWNQRSFDQLIKM